MLKIRRLTDRWRIFAAGLLTATFIAIPLAASPAWQPAGPAQGWPTALVVTPDDQRAILLATDGGSLVRSVDGGASFQEVSGAFSGELILALSAAAASGNLFAATHSRLFTSSDGGTTWQATAGPAQLGPPQSGNAVEWIPHVHLTVTSDGATQYLARGQRLLRGHDGQWREIFAGPTTISAVVLSPADERVVFLATEGPGGGLRRSRDGGATWTRLPSPEPGASGIHAFAAGKDALYVDSASAPLPSGGSHHLLRSGNGGTTWNLVPPPLPDWVGPMDEMLVTGAPERLVVGFSGFGSGYVRDTDDGGRHWRALREAITDDNAPFPVRAILLAADPAAHRIVGTTSFGELFAVFDTGEAGESHAAAGSVHDQIPRLRFGPGSNISESVVGGTVFRSGDAGATWFGFDAGSAQSLASDVLDLSVNEVLLAAGGGLQRSRDGGRTWHALLPGRYITLVEVFGDELFAGGFGLLRSLDGGAHAALVISGVPDGGDPDNDTRFVLRVEVGSGPVRFAAGVDELGRALVQFLPWLFVSHDSGGTWKRVFAANVFAVDPSDRHRLVVGAGDGVMISADSGGHFGPPRLVREGVGINALSVDPGKPSRILAGTSNAGVFVSDDGGMSWRSMNAGLARPRLLAIESITADPGRAGRFWLSTGGRFFVIDLAD